MKNFKRVAIFALATLSAFSCVAYSPTGEEIDETKTQLIIGYKSGGYGTAWVENADKMFEEKFANYSFEEGKTGVQVWVTYGKDEFTGSTFYDAFSGRNEDMYLGADIWNSMYNENYLYDLSDLVNEPLTEFGESKSIAQKVLPFVKDSGHWSGDSVWTIPAMAGAFGLTVYDVERSSRF